MPDLTPGTQLASNTNGFELSALEKGKFTLFSGTPAAGVTLSSLIAGEDLTNNVLKVEERFSYFHHVGTAGSTSGTVKSGAGFLHSVDFGLHTSAGTYAFYDSVGTSGTIIGIVSSGATYPNTKLYDVSFANGLTIVSGSVCDLTISFR